jgi:hypothetical protein
VLVERCHLEIGTQPDATAVGCARAGQKIDQRGLAGAVRPDDADAIAALQPDREMIDDSAVAIGLVDVLRFDD